jgi:hypothetical protein
MMRNPDARHLDFADLAGLIPGHENVLPSNLDMVYERRGHFLVAEWKRPREAVSQGQMILLQALARADKTIVLMVEGNTDHGMTVSKVERLMPSGTLCHKGNTRADLKVMILRWFCWADKTLDERQVLEIERYVRERG